MFKRKVENQNNKLSPQLKIVLKNKNNILTNAQANRRPGNHQLNTALQQLKTSLILGPEQLNTQAITGEITGEY